MTYEAQAALFAALGNPTRLALLFLLVKGKGRLRIIDLATHLKQEGYPTHPSNISLQLKDLRGIGLITAHKEGTEVYYRLCDDGITQMLETLLALLHPEE